MSAKRRWQPCVAHRGEPAKEFLAEYFGEPARRVLLIAGAGFDPRSAVSSRELAAVLGDRLSALFVREERGEPSRRILAMAERQVQDLRKVVPNSKFEKLDILADDSAVVGGRNAVEMLRNHSFADVTDIVVDMSALSIGTSFPIVRYCLGLVEAGGDAPKNLHVVVVSMPREDERRRRVSSDVVTIVHSFKGTLGLHSEVGSAKLWIPQLTAPKKDALDRIFASYEFEDVCPILPFPSRHPRAADELAEHFREQLENTWEVDARNVLYAGEDDPLDAYRSILDIEEQRRPVFAHTIRSVVVLSPIGSKAVALGALMAAIERDLPVVYVEALKYDAPAKEREKPSMGAEGELLHVWLHGEAYPPSQAGAKE